MVLCDSNIWLALAISQHDHHAAAREWLDTIEEPASVLFCRATQQSFLRLLTNASVLRPYGNPPLTNRQAWSAFEALLADDRVDFKADEPPGVEPLWRELAVRGTASPKLWMDAYLAAFALAGRYRMVTTDAAFRQFRGLDLLILGQGAA
ncbi:MAG TPA: TA system VapC family ribonuclease toxin [Thermoanaerobaculia bacterium]|nr:TA system VapC family ribonuclease toxin [Thermoanaerobaculia bacterium]